MADHRGEILKFIGDGLLAIFPLAAFEGVVDAAMNAMAAAHADRLTLLPRSRSYLDQRPPPVKFDPEIAAFRPP